MKNISAKKRAKKISAQEFDARFEKGESVEGFLDFKKATVVKRVNIDFPVWMVKHLDKEAEKLNVSRQAVVKVWISERLAQTR